MRVAGGRNQPEAEFIQGLLLEEGVPSVLRRTAGFDVPDFLAAGPRDVMVPEAGAETAIALLRDLRMGIAEPEPGSAKGPKPTRAGGRRPGHRSPGRARGVRQPLGMLPVLARSALGLRSSLGGL